MEKVERRRVRKEGGFKKSESLKKRTAKCRQEACTGHKSVQTEGGSIKGYSVRVTKHCLLVVTHQEGRKGTIDYEVNQRRVKGTPKSSCKTQRGQGHREREKKRKKLDD